MSIPHKGREELRGKREGGRVKCPGIEGSKRIEKFRIEGFKGHEEHEGGTKRERNAVEGLP
jgi:hypothetical protein